MADTDRTKRYIFTVTAGRSGQNSLTALLNHHVSGCYAAFEEPQIRPRLPGVFGDLERRFRRRFVETHEILGRGKVLEAYARGDDAYLQHIARRRMAMIERRMARRGAHIYVDVSKYFARGLHLGIAGGVPSFALIRLVRDPVLNMRSFLNRNKNFRLDNNLPQAQGNLLRMESDNFAPGEFYLWAWCEMYLRYDRMIEEFDVTHAVEIRTEALNDAARVEKAFDALGLVHTPVVVRAPQNTNVGMGYRATEVDAADVTLFKRFLDRLPPAVCRQISYFDSYDAAQRIAS